MAMDACGACHKLMDPLGLGFQHFDAIGRYRAVDRGKAVDASGSLEPDGAGAFVGVPELGRKLARSEPARRCFAAHFARFALGRHVGGGETQPADRALLDALMRELGNESLDVRELMIAIATSESFRSRLPAAGEVTQ
jgi:hypothetical protein